MIPLWLEIRLGSSIKLYYKLFLSCVWSSHSNPNLCTTDPPFFGTHWSSITTYDTNYSSRFSKIKAPIHWHFSQMSQFEANLYSQWPITYLCTNLYICSKLLVNSVLTKRERRKQKKPSMLRQCQSLCLKSNVEPLDQLQRNNCECFRQKRTNSNIRDQFWPHYVCPSNTKQYPKCKYRQSVVNVLCGWKRQTKKSYHFGLELFFNKA